MQWLEITIQTTSAGIDFVAAQLTLLGFDSFIMDDQEDFHNFLENNTQYWDYVDEDLAKKMEGISQIRLYLEDGPQDMEQISYLKDQLSVLKHNLSDVIDELETDFNSIDENEAIEKIKNWIESA